jgi:hypothetical protein
MMKKSLDRDMAVTDCLPGLFEKLNFLAVMFAWMTLVPAVKVSRVSNKTRQQSPQFEEYSQ